jgi:polyhydroxyalkanoate synthesis regulator phasin
MKLKLYSFMSVLLMVSFVSISAADDQVEAEYKNMEQMMGSIRLEKKQVESMLDKMVISGRISAEEGSKAKREIASMKDNDLENLKTRAIAEVKSRRLLDR